MKHLKTEFQIIYNLVQKGDTVLDLGCGNGELISHLQKHKKTFCYGVEREVSLIISCLKKKLNVVQIDLDKTSLLKHFQAKSFDTALMTQALQSVRRPDILLEEMLQLANHAIVTFPNFGNWKMRFQLLLKGKNARK